MLEMEFISIRERLKENRFLYFLVGCIRSLIHHGNLILHNFGFACTNKADANGMPIPPPKLRYRVHGDLRRKSFLTTGFRIYRDTSKLLEVHDIELSEKLAVLDFGCGCARLLGYFFRNNTKGKFTGTDIDGDAIAWAQFNYPNRAKWDINNLTPPLPYPSQAFDVVFAISVFTHFDEDLQFEWLRELHRIMATNGILICSVHGKPVWEQAALSNRNLQHAMSGKGFYFLQSNSGVRNLAGLPKFYQTAFHSEEYVRNHWGNQFHIMDYTDRMIGNHQTSVVLRKKKLP